MELKIQKKFALRVLSPFLTCIPLTACFSTNPKTFTLTRSLTLSFGANPNHGISVWM
jgi:hypothetical protein